MIKLAASNIGWNSCDNEKILSFLQKNGFLGLEIAPTQIVEKNPYECVNKAKQILSAWEKEYGLSVISMQSIWYGHTEKIFSSIEERNSLLEYTKKALLYANSIGCKNVVFGCPRNRVITSKDDIKIAEDFFGKLGDYAMENHTIVALEANPIIYNTNFLNTTEEVTEFVKKLNNNGIRVNLDLGTIIYNEESMDIIKNALPYTNHIHISEPNLEPIMKRKLHEELAALLINSNYDKYVSIEMKKNNDLHYILDAIEYVSNVFGVNERC